MNSLYTVAEIRAIEHEAATHLPTGSLMQRAGQAAAKLALELCSVPHTHAKVLILAGPGNNGGDALEVAQSLALAGLQVSILLLAPPEQPDAKAAWRRAQNSPAYFLDLESATETSAGITSAIITSTRWNLIIDGLFGIGLSRPISGPLRNLVALINHLDYPVLALDVPSGLDADTGNIVCQTHDKHHNQTPIQPGIAVRASHTITFIGDKPGLHTCEGRDYAGKVHVANLEIDHRFFTPSHACLNHLALFTRFLQHRPHNSHKGSYGDVAVIGGAKGTAGAVILASRAALFCGAGRVFATFLDQAPQFDATQPELMCRQAQEFDFNTATLLLGPGLGVSSAASVLLQRALTSDQAKVLDADALNLIASTPEFQQQVFESPHACIITPHPLEAARILNCSTQAVQADRLTAARKLAAKFQCTVILKGSGSIIAGKHDKAVINTTGNPALASAGTGDVLAGVCAALLAQGWPEWEAALAATWLHGTAADMLVQQGIGPIGLSAGELPSSIRNALNLLTTEYAQIRHEK
jgi:ADP-dependent NAD(P)H-hydrate dehydratase / NAD(P)H-hydrate epimerase